LTVRLARGLSKTKARMASTALQITIAQKTGTQEPVAPTASAATGPAKTEANPLAV